ncbi:hypothetical protein IOW44_004409 [Salmonella enterica]|nr:hypothetical protein [Salmonella enterica]
MKQTTDSLEFLRYVPLCIAVIFWMQYLLTRRGHSKYVDMQRMKQWSDLPRTSATESKEETLKLIVKAGERRVNFAFKLAIMFSVIAIFWLFYIR